MSLNQGTEQGNHSEENNEDDGKVENKFFNSTTRLKHRSCATAAENASQSCATCLKQDKKDYGYTKNYLYDADCWKPQL